MSETDHENVDDRTETTNPDTDEKSQAAAFTSRPTLKPATIALGLAILITLAVAGVFITNPTLLGTVQLTEVGLWVVLLIGGFVSVRLLIKMYILSRMQYTVSDDGVSREYSLLYRYRRREMPIRMVRGVEVSRDPIETVLGFGTVSILSGGTNQSLGFIEFEHVPNPERVREAINHYRDDNDAP